ncbi:hypothetical protein D9615_006543 [Tricholomella constricta]|uniref:DJ-1/PfpI domain-containing protein n=1 Tax=Tricholomella constricta TaxID=117010 RepID=A0A8H5HA95_9AGAR|nr:hypothetical protein D9615_006543 [Tricholomella constricta]
MPYYNSQKQIPTRPTVTINDDLHEFTPVHEYDLNSYLPSPPDPLRSDLVALEPLIPLLHADSLFKAFSTPPEKEDLDAFFYPFPKGRPHETRSETLIYMEKQRRRANLLTFAIVDLESKEHAGIIALGCDPLQGTLDVKLIGVKIFPKFRSTHVFLHASYLLLSYALNPKAEGGLGVVRVGWRTPPVNTQSQKAAEKLGFTREGVMRCYEVSSDIGADTPYQDVAATPDGTGQLERYERTMADLVTQNSGLPLNFGVIIFPGFQLLDACGPLDALNTLAHESPMNLSVIAATMEPVSTKLPASLTPNPGNFGESIVPTHTFDTAPNLDVLLIPGGRGTKDQENVQGAIDFVAKVYPSLKYLITVCSGAGIAARAGVLDGKRATTNKMSWAPSIALRTQVTWIAHARWIVDGNIWTSSGVSAGLDVIFAFIAEVYGGKVADHIANVLEYERHTDPTWDPFAELHNLKDSKAS